MNKIFKVIFNRNTQQLQVVSELASNHGKVASSSDASNAAALNVGGVLKLSLLAATLSAIFANSAHAAVSITSTGTNTVNTGGATGTGDWIVIGNGASTSATTSVGATTAIAIGKNATADGAAVAIGEGAVATGDLEQVAIGSGAQAVGQASIAVGHNANGSALNALAVGRDANATGNNSVAVGNNAQAKHLATVALGSGAITGASNDLAIGPGAVTTGVGNTKVAIGMGASASGQNSVAVGLLAKTNDASAAAFGEQAQALGSSSVAAGHASLASGGGSTAIGLSSNATKFQATAVGSNARAWGADSVAVGAWTKVEDGSGYSTAIGQSTVVTGSYSFAGGHRTEVTGQSAIGVGDQAKVFGANNAIAMGTGAQISSGSNGAISMGTSSRARAVQVVAIGVNAEANATRAVAIGKSATSNAQDAIAIGNASSTGTSAINSIAIGNNATANSNQSIIVGSNATGNEKSHGAILIGANTALTGTGVNDNVGSASVSGNTPVVVVGYNATSGSRLGDTIIGSWAKSQNSQFEINQATAIGNRAYVYGDQAVAVGADSRAIGNSSIAIGGDDIDKTAIYLAELLGINRDDYATEREFIAAVTSQLGDFTDKYDATTDAEILSMLNQVSAHNGQRYANTASLGDSSIAIGTGSQSYGAASLAFGANALTEGKFAVAVGTLSRANGSFATVVGTNSTVTGERSAAFGSNIADVDTVGSVVLGDSSTKSSATAVDTATVNGVTYSGFAGDENVVEGDYVSVGSEENARQIKFVAPGEITATSTDAINGSQLYMVAVEAAKHSVVKAGQNISSVETSTAANGATIYTVNAIDTNTQASVSYGRTYNAANSANAPMNISTTVNANGSTNYAVNVFTTALTVASGGETNVPTGRTNQLMNASQISQAINNSGFSLRTGTTVLFDVTGTQEGESTSTLVTPGDFVQFNAGDNLVINQDRTGYRVTYALAQDLQNINSIQIVPNASAGNEAGIDMGDTKITNLANGTNPSDAVNLSQLNASKASVIEGSNVNVTSTSDENGTVYTVNAYNTTAEAGSDAVKVEGTFDAATNTTNYVVDLSDETKAQIAKEESVSAGENVVVTVNGTNETGGNDYKVEVKGDLTNITSIANGDTHITLGDNTVNVNNATISNVANGTNATDAVNLSQLNASKASVIEGSNVNVTSTSDENGTVYTVNAYNTTAEAGSDAVTVEGTFDAATNTTNYVVDLSDETKAQIAKEESVSAGENVVVTVNGTNETGGNDYKVEVKGDLTNITSIANGDTHITLGDNTVNVNNATISNVANGTNATDAVNLSQLNASKASVIEGSNVNVTSTSDENGTVYTVNAYNTTAEAGSDAVTVEGTFDAATNTTNYAIDLSDETKAQIAKEESVSAGENVVVTVNGTNETGGNDYKVEVKGDLTNITSIANGDTHITLGDNTVNVNNATISNVANGTNATDAVNLSQLNASKASVIEGSNVNVTSTSDENGTVYTVNAYNTTAEAGSDAVKVEGSFDAATNTTNYVVDLSDATKAQIAKEESVSAGENVVVTVNGTNETGGNDYKVEVKGDLTNITSIANGDTNITLGDNTVNVNNATISNVANGTNATDAVNLSQLNASKASVIEGSNVNVTSTSDENGTVYTVNAYNTTAEAGSDAVKVEGTFDAATNTTNYVVDLSDETKAQIAKEESVSAGENVVVTVNGTNETGGNDYKVEVKGDLTNITSIANGDTNITLGDNTVNVNNATISNVANGTNATDAVNLSQLNASKASVIEGSNVNVTSTSDENGTVYTVNAYNTTAEAGSDAVKVEGSFDAATNTTNYVVDLSDETKAQIAKEESVSAGENVVVTVNGTNETGGNDYKVEVKGDLTNITSIANGDTNITLGDNTVNVNNATISNVANGTNATDAVNLSQLNASKASVIEGSNVNVTSTSDENGTVYTVNAYNTTAEAGSDAVKVEGTFDAATNTTNYVVDLSDETKAQIAKEESVSAGENVVVTVNGTNETGGNDYKVEVKGDLTNITSIANGDTNITLGDNTVNVNNATISNVANGTNATDAVNLSQLNASKASVIEGSNVNVTSTSDENGTVYTVNAYNTTAEAGSDAVKVEGTFDAATNTTNYVVDLSDETKAQIAKEESVSAGENVVVTVNGTNETGGNDYKVEVKGDLTNITSIANGDTNITLGDNTVNVNNATISNVANGTNATDAVNLSQLNASKASVIEGSNVNVTSTSDENGTVYTVSAYNTTAEAGSDAVKVEGTFDAATNTTNYVVDLSDETKAQIAKEESVSAGENVVVTVNGTNETGGNDYKVEVKGDLTNITSIANGDTNITLGDNTVNVNNATISNVANGTNATDAVNLSQLNASKASVIEGSNVNVTSTSDENGTVYTVNAYNTTAEAGSDAVKVEGTFDAATNTTNYVVDLSDETKAQIAKEESVSAGENVVVTVNGTNETGGNDYKVEVKGDLTNITSIANGDTNITLGDNTVNVNNATISNVANGTNATDAVNLSQLNASKASVIEGSNVNVTSTSDENGTVYTVNAYNTTAEAGSDAVKVEGTFDAATNTTNYVVDLSDETKAQIAKEESVSAGENVVVSLNGTNETGGNDYKVEVKGDLTNITSIANGDTNITLGDNTVNVNNATISNVANGTNATDAVNLSQLNASKASVIEGSNVNVTSTSDENGTVYTVNAYNTTAEAGSDAVKVEGSFDAATNTTNYVVDLSDETKAQIAKEESVSAGENVVVSLNGTNETGGNDYKVEVKGDLTNITSIANGDTHITLGDNTVNVNNATISNVANGTNATDAVNLSQLNASKASVIEGSNVNVTSTSDENGTVYTVNAYNTTAEAGSDAVKVEGTFDAATNTTNYVVDLSDETKAQIAKEESVSAGENVVVSLNGTNETGGNDYKVEVKGDLTNITSIANGDTHITLGDNTVNVNNATITNVASTLPDSTGKTSVTEGDISPVITETAKNNAATVGDVLNAGWNLQANGEAKDFVRPYDTVNFVNGTGTVASVTTDEEGKVSNVTFHADIAPISNNADGSVTGPTTGSQLVSAKDVVNAINNSGFDLNSQAVEGTNGVVTADSDTEAARVNPGSKVTVNAGRNIEISRSGSNINIATSDDPVFNTTTVNQVKLVDTSGNTGGATIQADGDAVKVATSTGGAARITNVAAGVNPTDAVNVSQLKDEIGGVHNRINKVDKGLRAGIAGANAAAGLPQVYIPGKSMVAASAGTFKGESAVAVGYSRASDNGKLILKIQGNANTRGDFGGSVGVGYQW